MTNRDLTTIKPIEAVPHIKIPCFYMVGKEDIIARPEKVKSLFLTTNTEHKEYWTFKGLHNSARDRGVLRKAVFFVMEHLQRLNDIRKDLRPKKKKKLPKKERMKLFKRIQNEYLLDNNNFLKPDDKDELKSKRFKKPKKVPKSKSKEDPNKGMVVITNSQIQKSGTYGGFEKVSQPNISSSKPPQPSVNDDPPIGLEAMSRNIAEVNQKAPEIKSELDDTQPSTTSGPALFKNPSFGHNNQNSIPSSKNNLVVSQNNQHETEEGGVVKNELAKMNIIDSFRAPTPNDHSVKEEFRNEISMKDLSKNERSMRGDVESPSDSYLNKLYNNPEDKNLEIDREKFDTLGGGKNEKAALLKSEVRIFF